MVIEGEGSVDLSIMPWLECDLRCPHCQYDAGPELNHNNRGGHLSQQELFKFLRTVNWSDINSIGFYGGEMFLDLPLFSRYVSITKQAQLDAGIKKTKLKPMWVISNGTFSKALSHFGNVVSFIHLTGLKVFISTTPHHKAHQHPRIRGLAKSSDNFKFKKDDTKSRLLPMGRNYHENWYCSRRCQRLEATERIAIKPNGDVIYQKCDGIYPVLGSIAGNHVSYAMIKLYMKNYIKCPMLDEGVDLGEPSWVMYAEKRLEST